MPSLATLNVSVVRAQLPKPEVVTLFLVIVAGYRLFG